MLTKVKIYNGYTINITCIEIGNDLNISIYGGDAPHIGAVALGVPRKSLNNDNVISSTVSLLTVPGHKEDEIVFKNAKKLSSSLNKTIVLSCGIHYDNISFQQIKEIIEIIESLCNEILSYYSELN